MKENCSDLHYFKDAAVDLVAHIYLQIDRRLCAKSESFGSSGRVFSTLQLLPLGGGSEEPKSPDVVRCSHGPGCHAWSWKHH